MTTRLGLLAISCLIVAGLFLPLVVTVSMPQSSRLPEEWPMNFALVRNGDCKVSCVQWISAEGTITADTAKQFKKFLRRLNGQRLPVVFQSRGGYVDSALAMDA